MAAQADHSIGGMQMNHGMQYDMLLPTNTSHTDTIFNGIRQNDAQRGLAVHQGNCDATMQSDSGDQSSGIGKQELIEEAIKDSEQNEQHHDGQVHSKKHFTPRAPKRQQNVLKSARQMPMMAAGGATENLVAKNNK